jgi:hypothetical protein
LLVRHAPVPMNSSGAAQESNPPTVGPPRPAGVEDRPEQAAIPHGYAESGRQSNERSNEVELPGRLVWMPKQAVGGTHSGLWQRLRTHPARQRWRGKYLRRRQRGAARDSGSAAGPGGASRPLRAPTTRRDSTRRQKPPSERRLCLLERPDQLGARGANLVFYPVPAPDLVLRLPTRDNRVDD